MRRANEAFVKEQIDIAQGVIVLAATGGAIYGLSHVWIKAKSFIQERRRDNSAYLAAKAAFDTPDSDNRLRTATDELTEAMKGAARDSKTDAHLSNPGQGPAPSPGGQ